MITRELQINGLKWQLAQVEEFIAFGKDRLSAQKKGQKSAAETQKTWENMKEACLRQLEELERQLCEHTELPCTKQEPSQGTLNPFTTWAK